MARPHHRAVARLDRRAALGQGLLQVVGADGLQRLLVGEVEETRPARDWVF
jgi:hypothetical protein